MMDVVTHPLPPGKRWLVTAVVMAAVIMVVLDTTIANVALPHMQATLGATPETVAWVLTSYILASAVAMPVTGWLSDRLGRRLLFTLALAGFTGASALCGIASSLPMMVAARIIQGACGAFLSPMSQAIMYDINPREKHSQAMTIWGMAIMIAPVTGPVIGGWLTDNFDWRWIFFVNVPIGIATAIASWALLSPARAPKRKFDTLGFILLAVALAGMQLMLDRGSQKDWLQSTEILIEGGAALAAAWMFVVHTATAKEPLLPGALFKDRNFVTALLFITVAGGILFAGAALIAPMLQRLLGYPVFDAGLLIAPRGLGTMVGMLAAGRLAKYLDSRFVIAAGMALIAVSLYIMTRFDLVMGSRLIVWSGVVQGLGLGLSILPMNLLAMATLGPRLRTDAAALYNLMRSIGGSVAISLTTAILASNAQISHSDLASNVTTVSLPFLNAGLIERLGLRGEGVLRLLDLEVNRQALMIAYLDDYWLMMWAAILVLPLILLMRKASGPVETAMMAE